MQKIYFKDWLSQQESTAFTRRRSAANAGLMPDIPDSEINRHSTFPYKKNKKTKSKKKLSEASKKKIPNRMIDGWISEIENLQPDLESLKAAFKKKIKQHKKTEPEDSNMVNDKRKESDESNKTDKSKEDKAATEE